MQVGECLCVALLMDGHIVTKAEVLFIPTK